MKKKEKEEKITIQNIFAGLEAEKIWQLGEWWEFARSSCCGCVGQWLERPSTYWKDPEFDLHRGCTVFFFFFFFFICLSDPAISSSFFFGEKGNNVISKWRIAGHQGHWKKKYINFPKNRVCRVSDKGTGPLTSLTTLSEHDDRVESRNNFVGEVMWIQGLIGNDKLMGATAQWLSIKVQVVQVNQALDSVLPE